MQDLLNQLIHDQFVIVSLSITLLLTLLCFHAISLPPMIRITPHAYGQLNLTLWGAPLLRTDPSTVHAIAAFLDAGAGEICFPISSGDLNVSCSEDGSAALHVRTAPHGHSTTFVFDAHERQRLIRALQATPLAPTVQAA
ncbi:hypothetical protein [Deinococcus soli (ex Cha et al. 2016)]|uniref:Uncharacterized protein n=2 Tax=Deinococcus soli (ex Cha et al. 2016) TaxID=1309411 RepID=A0ACC6KGC3_9DEIO|nr:hypothetical protein [Deinococcus soli (ex Cha et al. 2016)]MDR6218175.1 hypothetical protein [Deinococcus soli (ex Cha et al. 2016)]MDR6328915.1 hypothetical protein [Deinococcus soli (ex Cha et al. 2016)]MDR6751597.1 hypothetical protein [Deinococcus soli (ex Cha et al. 2016)]